MNRERQYQKTIQDFVLHPQSGDYYDATKDRFACLGISPKGSVVELGWYAAALPPEARVLASWRIWSSVIIGH